MYACAKRHTGREGRAGQGELRKRVESVLGRASAATIQVVMGGAVMDS